MSFFEHSTQQRPTKVHHSIRALLAKIKDGNTINSLALSSQYDKVFQWNDLFKEFKKQASWKRCQRLLVVYQQWTWYIIIFCHIDSKPLTLLSGLECKTIPWNLYLAEPSEPSVASVRFTEVCQRLTFNSFPIINSQVVNQTILNSSSWCSKKVTIILACVAGPSFRPRSPSQAGCDNTGTSVMVLSVCVQTISDNGQNESLLTDNCMDLQLFNRIFQGRNPILHYKFSPASA